ncbi:1-acyl-sn-glycerol-3-phosphate acyltransferase [Roseibacterium elongatum DSM 19469]|uniref:1-acyl-sn-glycerol-3-phosphate acyltransferase n=1 Tax=Roseicyclus elongatus DSM 19469 TaxID=1294273 RepID=W8RUZ4_9RHOB|nr:lysophospholipid acyltransferase family protein [Roseibacterium elongatum]AHM05024.1 1-acyl-sn-glycerol-3-phosphate acyltransferase [Roseibacterium elongatum DSM 19469]
MSVTWTDDAPPPPQRRLALGDWLRVARRGGAILVTLMICFPLLLLLRVPERALFGLNRPVTPWITQAVCVLACRFMGLRRKVIGQPMPQRGAFVANHSTWLDIFVLNAGKRLYFVSKAEVAGWAGIGWLARGTGTVFIRRDRRSEAAAQTRMFEDRLRAGHKLLFFPEGTSTDGRRVLPFKTTLFAAFLSDRLRDILWVQPISLHYHAPHGADARFYGWWGDMEFGANLLQVLAAPRQGWVELRYGTPLKVSDFEDRKALARAAERAVRAGYDQGRSPDDGGAKGGTRSTKSV